MVITHEIQMDVMGRAGRCDAPIRVMQDDRYCRNLKISLLKDGVPMAIVPQSTAEGAEVTALVRYSTSDGTGGNYDTMPDGKKAYSIDAKAGTVTVELAPQVLTVPGEVKLTIALIEDQWQLHTFVIKLLVEETPGLKESNISAETVAIHAELDKLLAETDEYWLEIHAEQTILEKIRHLQLCTGAIRNSISNKGVPIPNKQPFRTLHERINQIESGGAIAGGTEVADVYIIKKTYRNAYVGTWSEITEE